MEPSTAPTHSSPSNRKTVHPLRDMLYQVQIVLVVALVLATLFTAWTPAGLLPGNLGEKVNLSLAPQPTNTPVGAPTSTPRLHPLIGIIAGHSGNDSGAVCADGLTEAQVNMDVATRVQAALVQKGFDVDLLKEFDPKLDNYQASALISIHTDSCDYINDQATGFKVVSSSADPRPERAARLTACIRSRYAEATGLSLHNSITADMYSYHAFNQINPETTAAIIEIGFLNLDRQVLTEHPDEVANGIINGIVCFMNNEEPSPSPSTPATITPSPQSTP